jgi:hypothetical protein
MRCKDHVVESPEFAVGRQGFGLAGIEHGSDPVGLQDLDQRNFVDLFAPADIDQQSAILE